MTTLCPAVEKYLMVLTDGCPCNDCEDYRNDFRKCATLQAEWEREGVNKLLKRFYNFLHTFQSYRIWSDGKFICEDCKSTNINVVEMMKHIEKELGIEQEEKK